ncbi:serine hydrolase [Candidatus Sumerlaeota bacterium]|nr:serine hydrolase [Candidatus Sumerlaeota bacterium]
MLRKVSCALLIAAAPMFATAQTEAKQTQLDMTGVEIPKLENFKPLPAPDKDFSSRLEAAVKAAGLDHMTPADQNSDEEDEWSSICLVDLSDPLKPRVAGWKEDNFVYPASTYKMYVLGEVIREVVDGKISLDDEVTAKKHNLRGDTKLKEDQKYTVSEILRLVETYSDNSAANEAIDLVGRKNATALMWALGCKGSEITRKYLPRNIEDPGYSNIVSTTTCAQHLATFLWAVESGAIGGGRGRGLIKSYMAMDQTDGKRFRAGLPKSATTFSKTGWFSNFTSEVAIVEDGKTRYILCALTAEPEETADAKLAKLAENVHAMMKGAK